MVGSAEPSMGGAREELVAAYRSWLAAAESAAGSKARVTLRVRDLRKQRLRDQVARAERSGKKSAAAAAEREQATWAATTKKWNSGASAKFAAWYDRASVPDEQVVRAALVAAVNDLVPTAPHTVGAWTSFGDVVERLAEVKHEGARHAGRVSAQAAGKQKRSEALENRLVVEPCRAGPNPRHRPHRVTHRHHPRPRKGAHRDRRST